MAERQREEEDPVKHMGFRRVGSVFVIVHDQETPADEEWQGYVDAVAAALKVLHAEKVRHLVFTDGGAPSALQRKAMTAVIESTPEASRSAVAIVTASPAVRAMVTMMSWFKITGRAFAPERAEEAIAHLGVAADQIAGVLSAARELRNEVGGGVVRAVPR